MILSKIDSYSIILSHLLLQFFLSLIMVVLLLLLCYFTPNCYILGSGKEEVLGRGGGFLPEPKYIYTRILLASLIKL